MHRTLRSRPQDKKQGQSRWLQEAERLKDALNNSQSFYRSEPWSSSKHRRGERQREKDPESTMGNSGIERTASTVLTSNDCSFSRRKRCTRTACSSRDERIRSPCAYLANETPTFSSVLGADVTVFFIKLSKFPCKACGLLSRSNTYQGVLPRLGIDFCSAGDPTTVVWCEVIQPYLVSMIAYSNMQDTDLQSRSLEGLWRVFGGPSFRSQADGCTSLWSFQL